MNTRNSPKKKDSLRTKRELQAMLAEYRALRSEILQKFTTQYQIIAFQITYVTIFFAYIITTRTYDLLIIAPPLAFALASIWLSDWTMMMRIGDYLQEIEQRVDTEIFEGKRIMGWETGLREEAKTINVYYVLVMFGLTGVNFFIPLLCIALSLMYIEVLNVPKIVTISVNVVYILIAFLLIMQLVSVVPHKKKKESSSISAQA